MSNNARREPCKRSQSLSRGSCSGSIVLLLFALMIAPSICLLAVTVSVTEFSFFGDPGVHLSDGFVILNSESEPVDVQIEIVDWDRATDGVTSMLEAGTLERSCAAWLTLSTDDIMIAADSEIEIPVDIRIPSSVLGTYWAGILISAGVSQESVEEGEIRLLRQFLVRIFISVPPLTPDGRVSDLDVLGTNPVGIEVAFTNTGNTVLSNVSGLVVVESSTGAALFEIPVIPFSVLPGHVIRQSVSGDWGLQGAGNYIIRAVFDYGAEYLVAGQSVLRLSKLRLRPIGLSSQLPLDRDGDGLYEDVNGDGLLTMIDVDLLEGFISSASVQDNARAFDYDNNGAVDMGDVEALLETVLRAIE